MTRRLALGLAGVAALLGIGATAANAVTQQIYSPVPTGLVRVCVGVQAADSGVCIHL